MSDKVFGPFIVLKVYDKGLKYTSWEFFVLGPKRIHNSIMGNHNMRVWKKLLKKYPISEDFYEKMKYLEVNSNAVTQPNREITSYTLINLYSDPNYDNSRYYFFKDEIDLDYISKRTKLFCELRKELPFNNRVYLKNPNDCDYSIDLSLSKITLNTYITETL